MSPATSYQDRPGASRFWARADDSIPVRIARRLPAAPAQSSRAWDDYLLGNGYVGLRRLGFLRRHGLNRGYLRCGRANGLCIAGRYIVVRRIIRRSKLLRWNAAPNARWRCRRTITFCRRPRRSFVHAVLQQRQEPTPEDGILVHAVDRLAPLVLQVSCSWQRRYRQPPRSVPCPIAS